MNAAVEILKGARALVEQGWCQRAYARDESGAPVAPTEAKAVEFCATGAIVKASIGQTDGAFGAAIERLQAALGIAEGITFWNDNCRRTKEEVLAAFDRAIGEKK